MIVKTRDLILEEALKLFSEKGIKETTIRDIAKAVGITEGAIYRHFESKDQIVHELFEKYSSYLYEKLENILKRSQNEEETFREVISAFLDFAFKKPDAFRYLNIFHYLRGKEVRRFRRIPFTLLKEFILNLHSKGVIKVQPEYALAIVTGTLERVFLYRNIGIIKGRQKEIKEKTARMLWKSLTECSQS